MRSTAYALRTDDEASDKVDYAAGFRLDYPNDRCWCRRTDGEYVPSFDTGSAKLQYTIRL